MIRRFRPCTLLWALGLGLVGCAGCALERGPGIAAGSHTQEAGQIPVPASLVGSWVVASTMSPDQARITDLSTSGFLTIGPQLVVIALPGTSYVVSPATSVTIDPATTSGCIVLANGARLFLSGGSRLVEEPCGRGTVDQMIPYLDLTLLAAVPVGTPQAGASSPQRLWSARALAGPVLHDASGRSADSITVGAASPHTQDQVLEQEVAALAIPELQGAIRLLEQAHAQSQPRATLEHLADTVIRSQQRDILTRLQLAYATAPDRPDALPAEISDVTQRQAALTAFELLVATYLAGS
jgi:hypothetical protein